jgi:hypothetical protein
MFDPITVDLIRAAPALSGLDVDSLPKELTSAYAEIVSSRIRLRSLAGQESKAELPEEVRSTIAKMRKIAFTNEALVSVSPDREDRVAASFVAGAAHHVVLQAERLLVAEEMPTRIELDRVAPEVTATLLYLVAESCADAAEMAKAIRVDQSASAVEATLLLSIKNLAQGKLEEVSGASDPEVQIPESSPALGQQAADALYAMVFRGVKVLAKRLLGEVEADAAAIFRTVQDLSIRDVSGLSVHSGSQWSTFPGPNHLASLLIAVAMDLPSAAISTLPAPSGVDQGRWDSVRKRIARTRPFLWRNHRAAVGEGYLEAGSSAVVSFPTGAGKSTLSELKIASALLSGSKVIFLAPTLALVDQTAKSLAATFPAEKMFRERPEEVLLGSRADELPEISVMTPERCLALLSFEPDAFSGVGLLVFDECHLLHPKDDDRSRRSIDAMLCLLNFNRIAPEADFLLISAMMSNAGDISGWIEFITGRRCISLDLTWKPTRQVRGCVVYGAKDIEALRRKLATARAKGVTKAAPAATKRDLLAHPFGLFCLNQTWQSKKRSDYALVPLLDDRVLLSTGTSESNDWYLTPNGNQVSVALAVGAAQSYDSGAGIKTLIFCQTVPLAESAAKRVDESLGSPLCRLTDMELNLFGASAREFGGEQHLYIEVDPEGRLISSSAPHHGQLLQSERNLHESLFRRRDGIPVLVATSTLAQGMNLPSEIVIIAGDSRFDAAANKLERMEAHELLNAAGRAGRAGDNSYGFVLVVPSKVVHFDNSTNKIHQHWSELQSIFSQSDQCLEIEDPIEPLLDRVHQHADQLSDSDKYFLRRLPVTSKEPGAESGAERLLKRSLGAYFKIKKGDSGWVESRIASALAAREGQDEFPDWVERVAASAGIEPAVIQGLSDYLEQNPFAGLMDVDGWFAWVRSWLSSKPDLLPSLVRRETMESFFGKNYRILRDDGERGEYAVPKIFELLKLWLAGSPLVDIERLYGTQESKFGHCDKAREFALRVVPDMAYVFGLPAQVVRFLEEAQGLESAVSPSTSMLSACIRNGFDRVEKLALSQLMEGVSSRVDVHELWAQVSPGIAAPRGVETYGAVIGRVRVALQKLSQGT